MTGGEVVLAEGWYLMSVRDLELELARWRGEPAAASGARRLTTEEALAYRDAGNLPDEGGRSLRLVLFVDDDREAARIHEKRAGWEPDFHETPSWRREGSVPVNVVPLRRSPRPEGGRAWWDDPDLAALEDEWRASGAVAGLRVPGAYRSFVYKTVLSLQASGIDVTVDSVVASVSRWLGPDEALELRAALEEANG